MPDRIRVSAADLVRNFGFWQEKVIHGPVYVTHHRRDRLVLLSVEQYDAKVAAAASAASHGATPASNNVISNQDVASEMAALLDNISDAYLLLDPEEKILRVNARLEALWGVSRDQLLGRNLQDFIPAQKSTLLSQKLKRVLLTRQPDTAEFVSLGFPGVHLSSRIYPHPRGVLLLHTNVTELATLRLQIAEADSLKDAIDRHPQIAHAQIDAKGRFTYADETIQAWTGFAADTLTNTRISDICAPEDRRRVMEAVEDVISAHVPSALTARLLGRNFSENDVLLTFAPVMTDQNTTTLTLIAALVTPAPKAASLGDT